MTNVSEWSITAGSNNSAPPDGAPEGMLPGKVNDCMREIMAALAKWYQDQRGSLVTAGTTTAYTLTTNSTHTALSDIPLQAFRIHATNTGASTLNIDGVGARSLVRTGGTALASGDLVIDQLVCVSYNPDQDRFEVIGPSALASATAAGDVELATPTETKARADTARAVTPEGLADFARIKTGTYTGDGTTSQAITGVGFQPKYVKITPQTTFDDGIDVIETTDVIIDDNASGMAVVHSEADGHYTENNRIIALGADGFTVDDDNLDKHPNTTGVIYNYLCIG